MAFSNGLKSPQNESSFPTYSSPMRPIGTQMPPAASTSPAERAGLHRRFTTNALPTLPTLSSLTPLSPIGQQRRQAAEPLGDLGSAAIQKVQLLQRRKEEFEHLREQRKRFQTELELMDLKAKASEHELQRLEHDLHRFALPGHQSEPTTPPEYRDTGFPSAISRPNRLSMASLTSTQGVGSIASPRTNRSGSQSFASAFMSKASSTIPSSSMPGSRRGSDEEEDNYSFDLANLGSRRPNGRNLNRNSMPVTNFDLATMNNQRDQVDDVLYGGGINNINSIIGDEEDDDSVASHAHSQPNDGVSLTPSTTRFQMKPTSEGFPTLVQSRQGGEMPAAAEDAQANGWPAAFARHRAGQSMSSLSLRQSEENINGYTTPSKKSNRHSLDVAYAAQVDPKRSSFHAAANGLTSAMPPKLQQSYSTNDIPTVKNTQSLNDGSASNLTHSEQHLHNHNASIGRIPVNASNRQSRDFSSGEARADDKTIRPLSSVLQPSAPAFQGPNAVSSAAPNGFTSAAMASTPMTSTYAPNTYYGGGYNNMANSVTNGMPNGGANGMSMLNMGMNNMNIGSPQPQWANQVQMYQPNQYHYGGYQPYGNPRSNQMDSQARVMQQRRNASTEENARYANYKLENMHGQLYELCKDQHGCRFLQRKLEERDPEHIQMIFEETKDHVVELMTDPFGNYLCQKLLEFSTPEQRTVLIKNASTDMVRIALNQHGTRALQKMIEFINTDEQIDVIRNAFCVDVVGLIQDLNGNHVIQKCLNHLKPEDAQFIFSEVAYQCLTVGTHRHGCCVLQRCIDHATGDQKAALVNSVIANAIKLVQDPFGNYVVQYILDLNNPEFTTPLCIGFRGRMVELSKQKFSSNVMEKCLRVSDRETSHTLIEEFVVQAVEMEKLLRDHYANYVVQTALEHGDEVTRNQLWDIIIPILQNIRSTPCGRRLASKLAQRDSREGSNAVGHFTPESNTPPTGTPQRQLAHQPYYSPSTTGSYNNGYNSQIASPQPHRLSDAGIPAHLQNTVNHQFSSPYRGQPQGRGSMSFGSPQQTNGAAQSYNSPPQANGQFYASPGSVSSGQGIEPLQNGTFF